MVKLSIVTLLMVLSFSVGQDGTEITSYKLYRGDHRNLQATGDNPIIRYEGLGTHYFDLFVGNPAQKRTLAVTTNSDYTAFACEECTKCGQLTSNVYNSSASSKFGVMKCSQCSQGSSCDGGRCIRKAQTQDLSSWSGYEVSDYAFHGGGANPETLIGTDAAVSFGFLFQFVCQQQARGYFETSVKNGILGMSPAPTSFINQMYAAGKLLKPRFSLCFNDRSVRGNTDSNTGVVTFGGYEAAFIDTEMVYAKKMIDLDKEYSYRVNITKLHIRVGGGMTVRAKPGQAIIEIPPGRAVNTEAVLDSSVPFLTFDKRWESRFMQAWKEATGNPFSHGRTELTLSELEQMPTLLIELEADPNTPKELDTSSVPELTSEYNVLIAVPASRYMERLTTGKRPYRVRIHFDGDRGSTLGASFMQGHSLSYENDKNRIGFAESHQCEASHAGSRGRSIDNGSDELAATTVPRPLSINTASSGSVSTANTGTTPQAAHDGNDDLFAESATASSSDISPQTSVSLGMNEREDFTRGGCASATCRCFMAIGYVFIGTALAVAYRASRPKERTLASFENFDSDVEPIFYSEAAYRRKTWHEGGTLV